MSSYVWQRLVCTSLSFIQQRKKCPCLLFTVLNMFNMHTINQAVVHLFVCVRVCVCVCARVGLYMYVHVRACLCVLSYVWCSQSFDTCVLENYPECTEPYGDTHGFGYFQLIPFFCGHAAFCRYRATNTMTEIELRIHLRATLNRRHYMHARFDSISTHACIHLLRWVNVHIYVQ